MTSCIEDRKKKTRPKKMNKENTMKMGQNSLIYFLLEMLGKYRSFQMRWVVACLSLNVTSPNHEGKKEPERK